MRRHFKERRIMLAAEPDCVDAEVRREERGRGIPPFFESEVRAEVTALGFSGGPLMMTDVEVDLNSANSRPLTSFPLYLLLHSLPP